MSPEELLLVLDTNTHVHYQPFTNIDWRKIFSAKRIRLLIPLVVLDELDRIKNEHRLSHIRKRAQAVASLLDKYIDEESPELRRGVTLEFIEETTAIGGVKLEYNDDKLIVCVYNLENERNAEVRLITHDSGLTRRAKMRGLKTGKLPDELKIEFVDESDKKYKELEQKHRKLEKTAPDLQLKFENEEQKIERTIQPPSSFPSLANVLAYNALKQEYAEKIDFCQKAMAQRQAAQSETENSDALVEIKSLENADQTLTELNRQLDKINHQLRNISDNEFARFINESNYFLQDYWNYLERKNDWQNFWGGILEIKLVVANEGLAPAQEIEMDLILPEDVGVMFILSDQFPAEPLAPLPPVPPRIGGEVVGEVVKNIWSRIFHKRQLPVSETAQIVRPMLGENATTITFSKDRKRLRCKFKKLKHTQKLMLPPFYLRFENFNAARSFHCGYGLLADNTPEKKAGQLHFIIDKPLISSPFNLFGGGILGLKKRS